MSAKSEYHRNLRDQVQRREAEAAKKIKAAEDKIAALLRLIEEQLNSKAMEALAKINSKTRYVTGYLSSNTIKLWKILDKIIYAIRRNLIVNHNKLNNALKLEINNYFSSTEAAGRQVQPATPGPKKYLAGSSGG